MKLGRLLINNVSFDENHSYAPGEITLPVYQHKAVLDADYEDISSIENWDSSELMDWSRRRDEISPLFYAITGANLSTYGNLTAEQKLIGAKYFLVPYSLRVTNGIVTEEQDKINGEFLATETRNSRIACAEAMRLFLYTHVRKELITLANTQLFYRDIKNDLECFIASNDPGFKQFIFGLSPYVGVFAGKVYWSQALQDALINIYNGEY